MKLLVTGAIGFVGKNLCAQLKNIRDGKARNYGVTVSEIFEYDLDSTPEELDGEPRCLNVEKGRWHSLECLKSGSVLFECKDGGYVPLGEGEVMSTLGK